MKKVLFITFGYPDRYRRNRFIFSHEQVQEIKKNKIEVDVLDLLPDNKLEDNLIEEEYEGVKVIRLKFPNLKKYFIKYFFFKNKFNNYLKRNSNYNVIIFNFLNIHYFFLLSLLKKIPKKILIVHGADAMIKCDKWYSFLLKRFFLRKIDIIVTVSDATAIYISHGLPKNDISKIKIIYNGIKLSKFDSIKQVNKNNFKKKLNIEPKIPIFLTICNLKPRKGVDIVIKADIILDKKNIDFKHIIIGRGSEEKKLKKIVLNNSLNEKVIFIPYIEKDNDLMQYFAISDFFIMMSRTLYNPPAMEGFGIVYIEAQYLGIPVIAGKSGGVLSCVRDEFTGYLIDPEDIKAPEEIVSRIILLLEDKKKYMEMSKNASAFVKEKFSWKKNVEKLISYF